MCYSDPPAGKTYAVSLGTEIKPCAGPDEATRLYSRLVHDNLQAIEEATRKGERALASGMIVALLVNGEAIKSTTL